LSPRRNWAAVLPAVAGGEEKIEQSLKRLDVLARDWPRLGPSEVDRLQTCHEPLALDGAAGARTKQAALAFQTAAHLATDAIVGPLTWKRLIQQDF
jgi:peptidoglycan hydrolase-like protein with peptidoglycan-binding domain